VEAAEGCPGSRPALRRQPRASASAARRGARAVAERPPAVAFFAVIYYTGLRPEEAVSLRKESITLPPLVRNPDTGTWQEPPDNWGELRFCSAAPEAGAEWTDDGRQRDHRHLKSRPVGEWRRVPSHRRSPGFSAPTSASSAPLPAAWSSPGSRAANWRPSPSADHRARRDTLAAAECASPLAARVYDLRHACVSTWLNGGIPPAQVAEWAGHSVAVLLKIYAKCLDGQDAIARRRIEEPSATLAKTTPPSPNLPRTKASRAETRSRGTARRQGGRAPSTLLPTSALPPTMGCAGCASPSSGTCRNHAWGRSPP